MLGRRLAVVVIGSGVGLALGLVALAWGLGPSPSQAQNNTMQNCPQAGKWAISVWDGSNGTDTGQALATCGTGAVSAAYYIDPNTQGWLRWFSGRPAVSNLGTLDDKQGVIALGATGAPPSTATPTVTATATPASMAPIVVRGIVVGAPAQQCPFLGVEGQCWWTVDVRIDTVVKMEQTEAFLYAYEPGEIVTVVLPEPDAPGPDVSVGDSVEVSGQESMYSCASSEGVLADCIGFTVWPQLGFEDNYIQRL